MTVRDLIRFLHIGIDEGEFDYDSHICIWNYEEGTVDPLDTVTGMEDDEGEKICVVSKGK